MNKDVGGETKRMVLGDEEREDGLLALEELVPITQTLITPTLASFFNLNSTAERRAEEQEEADRPLPARALLGEQLDHGRLALALREVDAENTCSPHELGFPQSDQKLKLGIDRPPRASPHAPTAGEEGRSCNGNFVDASVCAIAAAAEPVEDCGEVQKTVELGQSECRKHDFVMGLEARASCKRQMNGFDYRLDDGVDDREGYGMNQAAERENSSNSGDGGGSGGGGGSARTLKRPRLVWTPQLHKRFVDAVSHLGIKNAVPKTIMQLMNVEGLTRENVASHLQKYRLYLRRVQQGSLFSNSTSKSILSPDHQLMGPVSPSSDHLFSSSTSSIRGQGDHHPHNHIIPQQMSLILQQPHHLQAAMVNTPPPPFNNSHFNPHLYNALAAESSPTQRSSWASPHVHMDHPHQSYHPVSQTTPPSPPRRALTLFPH